MGRIILGIDPGLANTGWGVVEQDGSGANVPMEKTGTWEYRAPKDAAQIVADGHGAAAAIVAAARV